MAVYYDCSICLFPLNSESLEYAYALTPRKVLSTKDSMSPGEYLFGVWVYLALLLVQLVVSLCVSPV